MNKGLEALHHPRIKLASIDISAEGKHDIAYMPFYKTKQYDVIENELKANEEYVKIAEKEHEELMYAQKKLKALEIIKELPDKYIEGLIYILLSALNERKISQKDYELLKEVLL